MQRVEKSWGFELIVHNGDYCCKKLVYTACKASSLHYHRLKHESFVIASGLFELEFDGKPKRRMNPGDSVVIPPKTPHRLRCLTPGMVFESSTHDDPADCIRIVPSE